MILLLRVFVYCIVCVEVTFALSAGAATVAWRTKSGEAFRCRQTEDFVGAVTAYKEALDLMPSSALVEERIDGELAVAQSLMDCKRYDEAEKVLVSIGRNYNKIVFSSTLLEVRYRRRYRDLYELTGRLASAAETQRQVVDLLTRLFGASSSDTMEELLEEISLLRRANLWTEASARAKALENGLAYSLRNDARKHYQQELVWFLQFYGTHTIQLIQSGQFVAAKIAIEDLTRFNSDPHLILAILRSPGMGTASSSKDAVALSATLWKGVISTTDRIPVEQMTQKERAQFATALFHRGLDELYRSEHGAAVASLKRSVALLESAQPPIDKKKSLFWIQCFGTCARAVALSGDAVQAEKMLSTLNPDLAKFSSVDCMYGIFQARRDLASLYSSKGNQKAAIEQYSRILSIIAAMPHCPDQKREYKMWKDGKDFYSRKIRAP